MGNHVYGKNHGMLMLNTSGKKPFTSMLGSLEEKGIKLS